MKIELDIKIPVSCKNTYRVYIATSVAFLHSSTNIVEKRSLYSFPLSSQIQHGDVLEAHEPKGSCIF